jgi:Flp pilus assembly protein TadG
LASNRLHYQRGASMVETAIVVSLFMFMLFGMIEFGRAVYTYHMVDNAARVGSRFAIVHGSSCVHTGTPDTWPCDADQTEIQNYVQQQSVDLGGGPLTVTVNWPSTGNCNATGCLVQVTATYPFAFLIPLVSTQTLNMSSTSEMVISQ